MTHHPSSGHAGHGVPQPGKLAQALVPTLLLILIAGVGAGVYLLGVVPRQRAREDLARRTAERVATPPRVLVVKAAAAPPTQTLTLPARLEAVRDASLYAREGGYLREQTADLGDAVNEGQVLAVIDTPVLDRQIAEAASAVTLAAARVAVARAVSDQSDLSLSRLESVKDPRAVSLQAVDEARAKAAADHAALDAARAEQTSAAAAQARLTEQKAQATIRAPFAGEVTQRGYDPGALILADKPDTTRPLFRITSRGTLRVFVQAPQSAALAVAAGQEASVSVRELPGRVFRGRVTRAAAALDTSNRTRLVEVRIDNADGSLFPGMFAECTFSVLRAGQETLVPGEAIVIRDGKTHIAVVDDAGILRYRAADIARDLGSAVELRAGAAPGDRLAVSLARQPAEGTKVEAVEKKE